MSKRVSIEVDSHIAVVSLNRPEKYNALDKAMFDAIIEAGESLRDNKSVRAVILTGSGDNFCAGIDVNFLSEVIDPVEFLALMQPRGDTPANFFQSPAYALKSVKVPVIAALRGVVYGGGLQIASAADVRFVTADARLSVMEMKWGLIPDMGITATLRGVMPLDKLKELA